MLPSASSKKLAQAGDGLIEHRAFLVADCLNPTRDVVACLCGVQTDAIDHLVNHLALPLIRLKAEREGIALKAVNRSPDNRRRR